MILRIILFSFTDRGTQLAEKLRAGFADMGHQTFVNDRREGCRKPGKEAFCGSLKEMDREPVKETFREAVAAAFREADALVFVGAAGIAVRGIAPYVRDKFTDPAVVSVDEFGRYAVPLLSGHWGGANRLAELVAGISGAVPVISTASDLNSVFAVDVWAESQFLEITDRVLAKEVTAALLRGENVGFLSDFPVEGNMPEGLEECPSALGLNELPTGFPRFIYVTYHSAEDVRRRFGAEAEKILRLVPRCLSLGCGCKRDFDPGSAVELAERFLQENGIAPEAVMEVSTIDIKEKEAALRAVARKFRGIYRLHSAETLAAVPGEFHESEFVRQKAGVGNVCERAAMCYGTELLAPKTAFGGITFALSAKPPKLSF